MLKRLLSSVFLCFALIFGALSGAGAAPVGYEANYGCGAGSGTMLSDSGIAVGSTYTPRENRCTPPAGKHFIGWLVGLTMRYAGEPFTWNYTQNMSFTAQYADGQFSVRTTDLTAGSTFSFKISAQGTFTINCGTGGNFNNTGNAVGTITRSNTTQTTYTCRYTSAGVKTISFGSSNVTAYNTGNATPAINFSGNTKVAALNGDLTLLFPHLGSTTSSKLHRFPGAFKNCTNLTRVPATLFENLTTGGSSNYTFYQTFYGCTSLTSLPNKLFGSSGLAVVGSYGFTEIFYGCSGLTALPSGLFQNVTGNGTSLFEKAFYGCRGLTAIPKDLFAGITVARTAMFRSTFENCTGLNTTISNKLFGSITTNTTSAPSLFQSTFKGCEHLTTIEQKFFSSVTNAALSMFSSTFENSGLKEIPKDLFSGVVTPNANATNLFYRTFYNCRGLYKVPPALFSSITIGATSMFELTFYNCILLPQIYADWFSGITTAANRMFYQTFQKCEALQEIPDSLFGMQSINTNTAQYMFFETFRECVGIEIVYKNLFAGITSGATHMFDGTFYGCTSLTNIGSDGGGLFRNISNTDSTHTYMFYQTFYGCSGLLYVPADTFALIPVGASYMFHSTFYNCTDLGAIGGGLFKNIQTTTSSDTYMFFGTFYNCSSLSAIPNDTFEGITVGASYMFGSTFFGCSSISSIGPLFVNIDTTTGATYMFSSTFRECVNVTYVDKFLFRRITDAPSGMFNQTFHTNSSLASISSAGLFSNIQSVASNVFNGTFFGCSSLTAIPAGLFSGIRTFNTPNKLFFQTFSGCSSLNAIPDTLFDTITTSAEEMFNETFSSCTGLTSIPAVLFRRISVGAKSMFQYTFNQCRGLRSIPDALFANITTGAESMFSYTFNGCTGLTGYVPKNLFRGLIVNHVSPSTNMFSNTFTNTGLSTSCGTGMQEAWTGTSEWNTYVSYKTSPWNSSTVKVSCEYVSYTVTYNCGNCTGGSQSAPNSVTVTYNSSFSPASNSGRCIAPNSGYTFAGWAVSNTNPVVYRQPNSSFTWNYTENKTFTATCNPRSVTMNWFNDNGTSFTPSNSTANQCVYDAGVTIPSNTPSKSGYHFVGWCLDTGLSPYWSAEWDMGYATNGLYWDASHARWEPIVQNGYTMYDEFGSGATSGGLNPGEWGYTFDTSTGKELLGRALCSATPGTHAQSGNPNQNTSGQHCWCAGIKYAESCEVASPSWVYSYNFNTEADCNAECAVQCVADVYGDIDFGQAIFGVTQ